MSLLPPLKFDEAHRAFQISIKKLNEQSKYSLNDIPLDHYFKIHFNAPNLVMIEFDEEVGILSDQIKKEVMDIFRFHFPK